MIFTFLIKTPTLQNYGEIREMTPFCKILNYLPKNSKIWIKIDPRGEDEDPSKITRLASNECDDTNKGPR